MAVDPVGVEFVEHVESVMADQDLNDVSRFFVIGYEMYRKFDVPSVFNTRVRDTARRAARNALGETASYHECFEFLMEQLRFEETLPMNAKLSRSLSFVDWFWQKYQFPSVEEFTSPQFEIDQDAWARACNEHIGNLPNARTLAFFARGRKPRPAAQEDLELFLLTARRNLDMDDAEFIVDLAFFLFSQFDANGSLEDRHKWNCDGPMVINPRADRRDDG